MILNVLIGNFQTEVLFIFAHWEGTLLPMIRFLRTELQLNLLFQATFRIQFFFLYFLVFQTFIIYVFFFFLSCIIESMRFGLFLYRIYFNINVNVVFLWFVSHKRLFVMTFFFFTYVQLVTIHKNHFTDRFCEISCNVGRCL